MRHCPKQQPGSASKRMCALRYRFEAVETQRQPITIRSILRPGWQVDQFAVQALQYFEHRTVV